MRRQRLLVWRRVGRRCVNDAHAFRRDWWPGVEGLDRVVDFAAVVHRLDEIGYRGKLSVEYFDLPEQGWGLEDPRAWALDLSSRAAAARSSSSSSFQLDETFEPAQLPRQMCSFGHV